MQAKRFIAADMRRALDMVKEEYGEDAMIISTERTAKGVELVATGESALDQLQTTVATPTSSLSPRQQKIANAAANYSADFQPVSTQAMPQAPAFSQRTSNTQDKHSVGLASGKTKQQLADELEEASRKMQAAKKASSMTLETWADKEYAQQRKQTAKPIATPERQQEFVSQEPFADIEKNSQHALSRGISTASQPMAQQEDAAAKNTQIFYDQEIRQLHDEIADMRETIEMQLLHMSHMQESQSRQFNDAHIESVTAPSGKADTSGALSLAKKVKTQLDFLSLPKAANDKVLSVLEKRKLPQSKPSLLWTHVLTQVSRQIASDTTDPIAQGGIYAFLGTTGVGKTTTIAKLAARYVLENGADDVVLITTDQHRIAAHHQLTSLAKVLNVRVEIINELHALPSYLRQLQEYDLILIDTPGMGYADPLLKPHLSVLADCEAVQNVLVLPANNQYQIMKASLHSYGVSNIDYCVMSKLDECATLSDAMGILVEHDLPLAYITDGQSVPEDIAIMKSGEFVSRGVNMLKSQKKINMAQGHASQ